jgi:hypothetical protein
MQGAGKPSRAFVKPTVQEVEAYVAERGSGIDAGHWVDHYESNGWKVGKNSMKDWRAAVRTWERNKKANAFGPPAKKKYVDPPI